MFLTAHGVVAHSVVERREIRRARLRRRYDEEDVELELKPEEGADGEYLKTEERLKTERDSWYVLTR